MSQNQPETDMLQDLRGQVNFLLWLVAILARPLSLWTRQPGTMGERALGLPCALGLVATCLWPVFFRDDPHAVAILAFAALTFGMAVVHGVARGIRWWRGEPACHSLYTGRSWFHRFGERLAKSTYETVAVLLIGVLTCLFTPTLGSWLIAAALCSSLEYALDEQAVQQRLRQQRDAELESRWYAEQRRMD